MSDAINPYQSPVNAAVPENPPSARGTLTENMLVYLKGASPWIRFIGILGFVSSGITVLWGVSSIAFLPLMSAAWNELPEAYRPFSSLIGTALGGGIILLCLGAGTLTFIPSFFLYRAGDKIRSYLRTGTDEELEAALKNNKSFWKFVGIICIISIAIIPVMFFLAIVIGVVSALS